MKYVHALILAACLALSGSAFGATLHAPAPCDAPPWLKEIVRGLKSCQCVDFTGDGVPDYIALGATSQVENKTDGTPLGDEWWVTSDRHVVVKRTRWYADHNYIWLARLDAGLQPIIISAYGFAEGIEYTLQKLDLSTGTFTILFYFDPVLVEADGQLYHGYPWDVSDILAEGTGGTTRLRAAMRPRPAADAPRVGDPGMGDNGRMPDRQKMVPVLFFAGRSTQPAIARLGPLESRGYRLDELVRLANGR